MFYVLMVGGVVIFMLSVFGLSLHTKGSDPKWIKPSSYAGLVVGVIVFALSWLTPQGQLTYSQLMASGGNGTWLIIDNSGGETLRHWVLQDTYVGSSNQSDGWQFTDSSGLCYVSGDAFVKRLATDVDLAEFRKTYKETYNIPSDQEPIP